MKYLFNENLEIAARFFGFYQFRWDALKYFWGLETAAINNTTAELSLSFKISQAVVGKYSSDTNMFLDEECSFKSFFFSSLLRVPSSASLEVISEMWTSVF